MARGVIKIICIIQSSSGQVPFPPSTSFRDPRKLSHFSIFFSFFFFPLFPTPFLDDPTYLALAFFYGLFIRFRETAVRRLILIGWAPAASSSQHRSEIFETFLREQKKIYSYSLFYFIFFKLQGNEAPVSFSKNLLTNELFLREGYKLCLGTACTRLRRKFKLQVCWLLAAAGRRWS